MTAIGQALIPEIVPLAPSIVPNAIFARPPVAMSDAEVEKIVADFAAAAGLAAGVAQLGEDSTAMPMHRLRDAGERSDPIIVIEAKLSRFVLPARLYVDVAGDDQTGAAAR